jgi:hypothetical protein
MHGACASTTHRYLTVQLVRFFYKVDTQNKAKVLRKVRAHCVCACALCVCVRTVCVCVCVCVQVPCDEKGIRSATSSSDWVLFSHTHAQLKVCSSSAPFEHAHTHIHIYIHTTTHKYTHR